MMGDNNEERRTLCRVARRADYLAKQLDGHPLAVAYHLKADALSALITSLAERPLTPLKLTLEWISNLIAEDPTIARAANRDAEFQIALRVLCAEINRAAPKDVGRVLDHVIECFAKVQAAAFLQSRRKLEVGNG